MNTPCKSAMRKQSGDRDRDREEEAVSMEELSKIMQVEMTPWTGYGESLQSTLAIIILGTSVSAGPRVKCIIPLLNYCIGGMYSKSNPKGSGSR